MKRHLLAFTLMLSLSSLAMAQRGEVIPGRYIVTLRDDAAPGKVIAAHGLAPQLVYHSAVKGFAGFIPPGKMRALQSDQAVVAIVPDRVVKAIGSVSAQGKPSNPAPTQVLPAGVWRIGGDPAVGVWTGQGIGVAVVDTGLDFAHPDLSLAPAASSFTAFGAAAQDNNGHGTHVGGIIAAKNNTIGVVGVAPRATLYAIKVLDGQGNGSDATVIAGLDWVHAHAATLAPAIRVVNMSLGREGSLDDNPAMRTAVQNLAGAGIAVVVAAGNDNSLEVAQQVPATYPEVLAVASTTARNGVSKLRSFPAGIPADTASYFTTDGAFSPATGIGVTISAPGEDQEDVSKAGFIQAIGILSTKLGGGTQRMSGTSMAAPHVSGVLARLFEANPGPIDVVTLRGLIQANALATGTAPHDSPTSSYTFDGQREGVITVPELWINN